ncbi:hypothetical protein RJ639_024140, partial [Escallonia herrerae]
YPPLALDYPDEENNEAKYEAIIVGLEVSLEVPIDDLTIWRFKIDCKATEHQIKKSNLLAYYEKANYLLSNFPKLQILHVRKGVNGRADTLGKEMTIRVGARRILQPYEKVIVKVQVDEVLTTSERLKGQDNPLD